MKARQRLALLSTLGFIVLVSSCDRKEQVEKKATDFTVVSWLNDCSPFESLNEERVLMFKKGQSVELSEAVGDEKAKGALQAKHPRKTQGTWIADEATRSVIVELDGTRKTYTLLVTPSFSSCVLIAGAIDSADMRSSWFGEADFSEGYSEDSRGRYAAVRTQDRSRRGCPYGPLSAVRATRRVSDVRSRVPMAVVPLDFGLRQCANQLWSACGPNSDRHAHRPRRIALGSTHNGSLTTPPPTISRKAAAEGGPSAAF